MSHSPSTSATATHPAHPSFSARPEIDRAALLISSLVTAGGGGMERVLFPSLFFPAWLPLFIQHLFYLRIFSNPHPVLVGPTYISRAQPGGVRPSVSLSVFLSGWFEPRCELSGSVLLLTLRVIVVIYYRATAAL